MIKIVCGVDVSKDWLDVHIAPGDVSARFSNDMAGAEALAAFCREHGAELVVMEASGGCERAAFATLWMLGQPCALVNPRQTRRFAEAMGALEKTDRIDAAVLARYGLAMQTRPTPPQSPQARRLKALVARLSQLAADITVNKQRGRRRRGSGQPRRGHRAAQAAEPPAGNGDRRADRRRSAPSRASPPALWRG